MKTSCFLAASFLIMTACNSSDTTETSADTTMTEAGIETTAARNESAGNLLYGSYVDDSYSKRADGADWVSVSIEPYSDQMARVMIRSRADKKRPSCTFDDLAQIESASSLMINNGGKPIAITLNGNKLTVAAQSEADNDMLQFYCGGGATIAGTYTKISDPIDNTVDKTAYARFLTMQNLAFRVNADGNTVTVDPSGLTAVNQKMESTLNGKKVVHSEIADLDANGYPEVYIYTQSTDDSKKGDVIAFVVNKGKSMSNGYMAPIADNPEASKGYTGHDEFAVVENTLVRRFPVSKDGKTGTKQVQYKLTPGEAGWLLVQDKVVEY